MAQIGSNKVKHVIVEPRDFDQIGSDYVGALIPNSSRPLGKWVHKLNPSRCLISLFICVIGCFVPPAAKFASLSLNGSGTRVT